MAARRRGTSPFGILIEAGVIMLAMPAGANELAQAFDG